jgi:alpha-1,6-mannosyltransferase
VPGLLGFRGWVKRVTLNFCFQCYSNSPQRRRDADHSTPRLCVSAVKNLRGLAFDAPPGVAYALNPLIILEIMGNCHFEGAMLFFLLAGIVALLRGYLPGAALFWALATASKLVPLLFLPIILVYLGWRAGFRFGLLFSVCCLALFLPLLDLDILKNMAGSLNLYFRQFAFNAGGYYVLKAIGKALAPPTLDVGRALGPMLGAVVFAGVWGIAFLRPEKPGVPGGWSLTEKLVLAATLYLALATTVHPWYIVLPFGLSLLTRWRFPLVWTAVAALSYSHYTGGGFQENYAWIAVEYAVLLAAMRWDMRGFFTSARF